MKIVFLDAFTANPGDLSWDEWKNIVDSSSNAPCQLEVYDRTSPSELLERASDAEILLTNKVVINAEVMAQLPMLRYIGVLATGYNVVDVQEAHKRGIAVTNIPAYSTDSVAQMVFAHILNIFNNVGDHAKSVRNGEWQSSIDFSYQITPQHELAGKTIGIVGLGNTGRRTAMIAQAFGLNVLAYTSKSQDEVSALLPSAQKAESINDIFSRADIVSLHCPLTDTTRHIVNAETLALMKPTAVLINTGRGPLVDEEALADALKNNRIYAAGLDVLTEEPPRKGSPLLSLPNCHITPHIAWATAEARKRLMNIALANVKAFIAGEKLNRL